MSTLYIIGNSYKALRAHCKSKLEKNIEVESTKKVWEIQQVQYSQFEQSSIGIEFSFPWNIMALCYNQDPEGIPSTQ